MNSTILSFSILVLISILFLSCPKDSVNPCDPNGANNLPAVSIESAMVMGNKIIVKGTITSIGNDLQEGVTAHGVVWSSDLSPTINDEVFDKGTASSSGPFTAELNGFSTGTINFRTYARNCAGTVYSSNLLSVEYSSGMLEVVSVALAEDSNNNGIVNNGETASYNFAVLNSGDINATNIEIEFNSDYPEYIENFTPATINIPEVNSQSTSSIQNFSFGLNENIPEGEYCIVLNISANGGTIESSSSICFDVQTIIDADFSITNNECFAPCTLTFDASTSLGSDLSLSWDFGDGSDVFTTNDIGATHLYEKSGDYLVTLIVEGAGGTDTISKPVEINAITFKKKLVFAGASSAGFGKKVYPVSEGYEIFAYSFNSIIGNTALVKADLLGESNPSNQIDYPIGADVIRNINDSTFYSGSCYPSLGSDYGGISLFDNKGNTFVQRNWVNDICNSIQLLQLSNGNFFLVGVQGGPFQGDGPIFAAELDSEFQTVDSLPSPLGNNYSNLSATIVPDGRIFIAANNKLFQFNHFEDVISPNLILLSNLPEEITYNSNLFITPNDKLICLIDNNDGFRVLLFDLNGTIITDAQISLSNTIIHDAFVDQNNEYLIVSGEKDNNTMIAKYSLSNLNSAVWLETFSYIEGSSRAYSISPTLDGGYIMTGGVAFESAGILIKTNHLGQVEE